MKNSVLILSLMLGLIACGNDTRSKLPTSGNFGAEVKTDSLKTVNDVINILQTQAEANVNVTGTIEKVCKGEGCWLTLQNKGGDALLIEIANKAFVLPKNIEGKIATVTGKAINDTNNGKANIKVLATAINIK